MARFLVCFYVNSDRTEPDDEQDDEMYEADTIDEATKMCQEEYPDCMITMSCKLYWRNGKWTTLP